MHEAMKVNARRVERLEADVMDLRCEIHRTRTELAKETERKRKVEHQFEELKSAHSIREAQLKQMNTEIVQEANKRLKTARDFADHQESLIEEGKGVRDELIKLISSRDQQLDELDCSNLSLQAKIDRLKKKFAEDLERERTKRLQYSSGEAISEARDKLKALKNEPMSGTARNIVRRLESLLD